MWVFCCGMYRSASTLQFQITSRLVKDAGVGQQIGWIPNKRFSELRDVYSSYSEFKVAKVHVCTDLMISEFKQNSALGIYTYRDIRDVYSSYMKLQQKPFEYFWNNEFIATCLDNYKCWTNLPRVLISKYEEIIEDIPGEVERIAKHLKIYLHPSQYQKIAADYTLELQQERVKRFRDKILKMAGNSNDNIEIFKDEHDESNLLHINHIDSAKVSRWKEDLSEKEVSLIENKVKNWCMKNKYEPSIFLQ